MVIKSNLQIFFKNILYVFIPMGIVYLAILVFLYNFITSSAQDVMNLINQISSLVGEQVDVGSESVVAYLNSVLQQINFHGSVADVLIQLFDGSFLKNAINGLLELLFENFDGAQGDINNLVNQTVNSLVRNLTVNLVLILLSIPVSSLLTSMAIRRSSARKTLPQKIISYIVKPITFVFYTAIVFFFGALWSPSIFITLFIILILNSYVSLFQAYVIYNDRHIKFREIVTLKNALFFFLSDVIIFAIVVLLVILFYLLFNVLYALILAIPFFIYTTNILSVGTEAYVYSKTRHKVELEKKQA